MYICHLSRSKNRGSYRVSSKDWSTRFAKRLGCPQGTLSCSGWVLTNILRGRRKMLSRRKPTPAISSHRCLNHRRHPSQLQNSSSSNERRKKQRPLITLWKPLPSSSTLSSKKIKIKLIGRTCWCIMKARSSTPTWRSANGEPISTTKPFRASNSSTRSSRQPRLSKIEPFARWLSYKGSAMVTLNSKGTALWAGSPIEAPPLCPATPRVNSPHRRLSINHLGSKQWIGTGTLQQNLASLICIWVARRKWLWK